MDFDFSIDDIPSASDDNKKGDSSDLDLDFSFDAKPDESMEETLEILEDDSDLDLDFSVMDKAMAPSGHDEDSIKVESSTAMDLDFSMDNDLEYDTDFTQSNHDDDIDYAPSLEKKSTYSESDEIEDDSEKDSSETLSESDLLSDFTPDNRTLSENRPGLIYENDQPSKPRFSGAAKLIVMTLFLFIVAIAGYAGAIMTGVEIPYISNISIPYIDKYIKPPAPEPVKLTAIKKSITSKFLVNSSSGTLFVISGEVFNQSNVMCKNIKLEGTLLSKEKKKIKTTSILCGNIISEEKLKTLDTKAITDLLTRTDAAIGTKSHVNPSKTIPFMLVFSDFPDNLETFTMTVTQFERVSDKK
ncbi:hypothetical protein MTBBW1_1020036 [Desulfamplus magnetovallimortis]|uniref:DUF3426 domain-containing protein n=2 Tax=Desulfamplus magnetovallimortis TaxID=1246637 RepID=A0A1W1H4Z5_9BACT|nr:hypothetical protein MTBBW1_1020036 [Desulfamplus magnetovallimortis]